MGVFDFIRDAGSKILHGSKEEKIEAAKEAAEKAKARAEASPAADKARSAAAAAQKKAAQAAEQAKEQAEKAKEKAAAAREAAAAKRYEAKAAFEERRAEAKKADELEDYVKALDLGEVDVRFDDGTAYVSGTVDDQDTLERIVLAVGNVEGVERVDEDLEVAEPADAAQMYTVQAGDTLSAIAERFYGDANRYNEIFEANRPMLSDPNLIYPGQVLRIP